MNKDTGNPFVGIASVIGGISVAIVAILAIFAKEHLIIAPWVVGALAAMGAILGAVALKREKEE